MELTAESYRALGAIADPEADRAAISKSEAIRREGR